MKKLKTFVVLFAILIVNNLSAQHVALDSTFGKNGLTVFSDVANFQYFGIDNKSNIIAVVSNGTSLTIAKTDADGEIDSNFGIDGILKLPEYHHAFPFGLKITKKNKILIIGRFQYPATKTIIMQFNEDGSFDDTFGDNGRIITNSISPNLPKVNLENDDFTLVGETFPTFRISKYNYSGEPDKTFGENGTVSLSDNETFNIWPLCIKILRDQTIFIAGKIEQRRKNECGYYFQDCLFFCKLAQQGDFVTDFADNGKMIMNIKNDPEWYESFSDVIEDDAGNLVLTGSTAHCWTGYSTSFICSFNSKGKINSNFGQNGFFNLPYSIDRKIIQSGNRYLIGNNHTIISVKKNGTLDLGFNNTGVFFSDSCSFRDLKLQSDNKVILAGSAIARINIPLSNPIIEIDSTSDMLTIFPNPAKDYLYFNTDLPFEIFDLQGKILLISKKSTQSVYIGHLKAGVYFIRFGNNTVMKFVKE